MGPDNDTSMSPEALSSLFQQRPIRPLPKRRLRERLSPEAADAIEYPPASQHSSPLFFYPSIAREEASPSAGRNYTIVTDQGYEDRTTGGSAEMGESEEEEVKRFANSKVVRRSHPEILNRAPAQPSKAGQSKHISSQAPNGASVLADGYDSFENTNNKKKRKIPSASDSALTGTHSLADINSLGISTADTSLNDHDLSGSTSPSYYGPGAGNFTGNNQGISGPGRGRFGRVRNGRSPLRTLPDANNSWVGRGAKAQPPQWAEHENENSGIISNAIANAEKHSTGPGQENISLLHQTSAPAKSRPASSKFTFTCDSQVPGTQWPGTDPAISHAYMAGWAKRTPMSSHPPARPAAAGGHARNNSTQGNNPQQQQARRKKNKKKAKRRAERELEIAAADRYRDAQSRLQRNPPKPEDMWICHFCEYERIFGEPPRALIRQYEIKDQKSRRQEEERKRLLEKAKAKSRKNKKPGNAKSPTKAGNSLQPTNTSDHGYLDPSGQGQSNTTDEEEYMNSVEDEFEESYSHDDPPMLLSDDSEPDYGEDDVGEGQDSGNNGPTHASGNNSGMAVASF